MARSSLYASLQPEGVPTRPSTTADTERARKDGDGDDDVHGNRGSEAPGQGDKTWPTPARPQRRDGDDREHAVFRTRLDFLGRTNRAAASDAKE